MPRGASCGVAAAGGAGPASTQGVGAACPIVKDSRIVALNDSVMEKNRTLTETEMLIPASKATSIGW